MPLLKSFFQTAWNLNGNPFPGKATYAEDNQIVYVPEMFGDDRDEFLRKFAFEEPKFASIIVRDSKEVLRGIMIGSMEDQYASLLLMPDEAHGFRIRDIETKEN